MPYPLPILAMIFATPWAALAAAGAVAAVPIVIHLLNRKRYKIVPWAAMRFLVAAQRRNVRRLRLEQWLLLATRVSVGVLLVAAFAAVMPWAEAWWQRAFPGGSTRETSRGRTHRILVVDQSYTLTAKTEDGSQRIELLKEQAHAVLDRALPGDGFSLIVAGQTAQALIGEPVDDRQRVADEIDELLLPQGTADTAGAVRLAVDLAGKPLGKYSRREVVFLTDLKRSGWSLPSAEAGPPAAGSLAELGRSADIVFLDVARADIANLAITGLTLADPLPMTASANAVTITVSNHGNTDVAEVPVELKLGRAPREGERLMLRDVGQKLVSIKARTSATVVLPLDQANSLRVPGDHVLWAKAGNDMLSLDNTRALAFTVRESFPILVVDGNTSANALDAPGEWVRQALQPTLPDGQPLSSPFRVTRATPAMFADRFRIDLSKFDCVFLCDPAAVSVPDAARLEGYLQRGGRIVVSLGPNAATNRDELNRTLFAVGKGILPGEIGDAVRAGKGEAFTLNADEESLKRPPLAAYRDDRERASIGLPPFHQYLRLRIPPAAAVRTVLSFQRPSSDPGTTARDPAVLEQVRGRGRVIVLTTTFNPEPLGDGQFWSNWAPHPTFLPFLHETVRHLLVETQRHDLAAGEVIEEPLPLALTSIKARLIRHDDAGDALLETVDVLSRGDAAQATFIATGTCGIYRVATPSRADSLYAVNVPVQSAVGRAEADLTRLSPAEIQAAAPESALQIVRDASEILTRGRGLVEAAAGDALPVLDGNDIARGFLFAVAILLIVELVLAWRMGSARASRGPALQSAPTRRPVFVTFLWLLPTLGTLAVLFTWGHALATDDLLGYLPASWRHSLERQLEVPQAGPGEGTRWRIETTACFTGAWSTDRWLLAAGTVIACGLAIGIYRRERLDFAHRRHLRHPLLLPALLRVQLILLVMLILLPQAQLRFEREAWPDLVIIIDDSQSMAREDDFIEPLLKERVSELKLVWERLAVERTAIARQRMIEIDTRLQGTISAPTSARLRDEKALLEKRIRDWQVPHRLNLVKALLAAGSRDWLTTFVRDRKMRVHVFRASSETTRIAELSDPEQCTRLLNDIIDVIPEGDSSRLGDAIDSVLKQFRGRSLNAIVLFSDGVVNGGGDLAGTAAHARRRRVPLLLAGIGEATPPFDLGLSTLRAEREISLRDRLIVQVQLHARGPDRPETVPVTLYEIVDGKRVRRDGVSVPAADRTVRLSYVPETAGDKQFIIEVPPQPGEADVQNNRLTFDVSVAQTRRVRVLLIDEEPRFEFRFIKSLFEREAEPTIGGRSVELNVLLLGADKEWYRQDKTALAAFPPWETLKTYDVVILGDVDPKRWPRDSRALKLLADFVRERGGGLLCIAGPHFMPQAYADTELADVLPVVPAANPPVDSGPVRTTYRPRMTSVGSGHPIFRFVSDDAENAQIWNKLMPLRWFATGYIRKRSAEALAVHPEHRAERGRDGALDEPHPLVLQQFVGNGRSMFFGFDETWLWRFRQDERRHAQFWLQTVRSLARSRVGRIELSLPAREFRRGEPIRITARFPDDAPVPPADQPVQVRVQRRPLPKLGQAVVPAEGDLMHVPLTRQAESRATYEAILSSPMEGDYEFTLEAPVVTPRPPSAEATVLPLRGELEETRLDESALRQAAEDSGGVYAGLGRAATLLDQVPEGPRVALDQPCAPLALWNLPVVAVLMLMLLVAEWLLRKRARVL